MLTLDWEHRLRLKRRSEEALSPDEKREQLDSLHDIEISLTENIKQLRKDYR